MCYQYTVLVTVNISVSVDTDMEKVVECGRADTVDPSWWLLFAAKSLRLHPTLCNPINSPPGSLVPGILQARTLEWVAISFFNA